MRKLSVWETDEARTNGWATLWLDGERIDIGLSRGRLTFDATARCMSQRSPESNPAALADKLDEIAATFKDAAKMERARLALEQKGK